MADMTGLEACSNAELIAIILRLEERIARLEKRNAELEAGIARLRKNSSTSSKPPSSDIVKPSKAEPKGKRKKEQRKIGGQPGHPKHERRPFAVEDLSDAWEYHLDGCPDFGHVVEQAEPSVDDDEPVREFMNVKRPVHGALRELQVSQGVAATGNMPSAPRYWTVVS